MSSNRIFLGLDNLGLIVNCANKGFRKFCVQTHHWAIALWSNYLSKNLGFIAVIKLLCNFLFASNLKSRFRGRKINLSWFSFQMLSQFGLNFDFVAVSHSKLPIIIQILYSKYYFQLAILIDNFPFGNFFKHRSRLVLSFLGCWSPGCRARWKTSKN